MALKGGKGKKENQPRMTRRRARMLVKKIEDPVARKVVRYLVQQLLGGD